MQRTVILGVVGGQAPRAKLPLSPVRQKSSRIQSLVKLREISLLYGSQLLPEGRIIKEPPLSTAAAIFRDHHLLGRPTALLLSRVLVANDCRI